MDMKHFYNFYEEGILDLHESVVKELYRVYGSLTIKLVERLKTPPRRMYIRVVTSRISREEALKILEADGVHAEPDPLVNDAIYTEVQGPFEIKCDSGKYVVVDEKTAVSLMLGANLYRPGVVKAPAFNAGERLLAVTRWGRPVACIETKVDSSTLRRLRRGLVGVNISSPYVAPKISETRAYKLGVIYPQSLPSIVTTHVLAPKPGELVVDMNASPGGKSSHIVQLTRGAARLVSIDRSEKKVEVLRRTLVKLGLYIGVILYPGDSRYVHLDLNLEGKVDKVLIDPPCSNLGVRPVINYTRTMKDIKALSSYQKQFLKSAYAILKPCGRLVYSTCTLTLEENEEVVRYAIEELGYTPVELDEPPPYSEVVKYKGVVAYRYSPLYYDMPGYFIAVLTK
jgi:16S rRNA (cytosine967-C5)-methyltransferase